MYDDEEIRKAQEQERRFPGQKGKPEKIDKKLLADVQSAFRSGSEREFMQVLRKIGISDASPKFSELVKLSRAARGPSWRRGDGIRRASLSPLPEAESRN